MHDKETLKEVGTALSRGARKKNRSMLMEGGGPRPTRTFRKGGDRTEEGDYQEERK